MSELGLLAAGGSPIGPTLAMIVGAGMAAQWIAWRTGIPSIIALLVAGLVLGPVSGGLDPDDLLGDTLFPLVSLAVALILFEGGLAAGWPEIRPVAFPAISLATVGMMIVGIWKNVSAAVETLKPSVSI